MRKALILAVALLCFTYLCSESVWADDIGPNFYQMSDGKPAWNNIVDRITNYYSGFKSSVNPLGPWDSPSTQGANAFQFSDPRDSVDSTDVPGSAVSILKNIKGGEEGNEAIMIAAGAHGNYITTSHRCPDCHADRDSEGTFKLTRVETMFEACDWCHGSGAASGFNIQTDNDSDYTTEYNLGHTMGYGIADGRWKAPDDTYPAYTPKYWLGGFTCFDCHSVHANPRRLLGFSDDGTKTFPIYNPGRDNWTSSIMPSEDIKYPAGSWLLIKNPDREIDPASGEEIPDTDDQASFQIGGNSEPSTVNKQAVNWSTPRGYIDDPGSLMQDGFFISEFCADCHDGNAGLSTKQAAVFSESLAAQGKTDLAAYSYSMGGDHDSNPRKRGTHYYFDSEDGKNSGPSCRDCHRGSSDCGICHNTLPEVTKRVEWPRKAFTGNGRSEAAPELDPMESSASATILNVNDPYFRIAFNQEQITAYPEDWKKSGDAGAVSLCCNEGFSWPHKTMSWKMLKDNLFGVDLDGVTPVGPGESRKMLTEALLSDTIDESGLATNSTPERQSLMAEDIHDPADDLDGVCLDCHNPYIWNPQAEGDLLLRGLP